MVLYFMYHNTSRHHFYMHHTLNTTHKKWKSFQCHCRNVCCDVLRVLRCFGITQQSARVTGSYAYGHIADQERRSKKVLECPGPFNIAKNTNVKRNSQGVLILRGVLCSVIYCRDLRQGGRAS